MHQRWFNLTVDGHHDVVAGLLREGQYEMALNRMENMTSDGVQIKSWLYDMAIYVLCQIEEVEEALKIIQRRVESGERNISKSVWYSLLDVASSTLNVGQAPQNEESPCTNGPLAPGNTLHLEAAGSTWIPQPFLWHLHQRADFSCAAYGC